MATTTASENGSATKTSNVNAKRRGRPRNLRHNIKIMNKDYHLVNTQDPEEMIVVHPPTTMLPGLDMDGIHPRDEAGRWIRVFSVIKTNGVERFRGKRTLILKHLPGDVAAWEDPKGNLWKIQAIEGVHAEKPRGKDRKSHRKVRRFQTQVRSTGRASPTKKPTKAAVEAVAKTE